MSDAKEFLNSYLHQQAPSIGFSHFGWAQLETPLTYNFYLQWLKDDAHADMIYLEEQKELKASATKLNPQLNTGLFFAFPYFPLEAEIQDEKLQYFFIAKYARGSDYHNWIIARLNLLIDTFKVHFPNEVFIAYTDSKPILERDYAYQSGLGWVGKNTCIIHPKHGSYFLIAEILTSLSLGNELSSGPPVHDFCGTCRACIDACPTQALSERRLDANLCLSYWTIESKKIPPKNMRDKFGKQFFGCDICQDVCPWNKKNHKSNLLIEMQKQNTSSTPLENELQFLREILTSSSRQLQRQWAHTPLSRARGFGLKRNALLYIGNNNLQSLQQVVTDFKKQLEDSQEEAKSAQLIELADWCLQKLK